jgi:hypothetical protein
LTHLQYPFQFMLWIGAGLAQREQTVHRIVGCWFQANPL